ncbi:uncharacterized protein LOC144445836 [Glandiceps talaboti]
MSSSDKKNDKKKSRRKKVHPDKVGVMDSDDTPSHSYELEEKRQTKNELWLTESSKFKPDNPDIAAGQNVGDAVMLLNNVKKATEKFKDLRTSRRKDFHGDGKGRKNGKGAKGQIDEYVPTDYNAKCNANRALISYFAALAKSDREEDLIDLEFVESMVDNHADINATDKHGQSILHEVARVWETDVAAFLIEKGADVNQGDDFGRTPLHIAAAVDYPDMVNCLLDHGADIEALTKGEKQTPLHYAGKNDAVQSLRALIKRDAEIHAKDYKLRTPLQIAAEGDRSETARVLLEHGANASDTDETGQLALVLMITKMPPVAKEALDQYHRTDRANRKQFYDLHCLEPSKPDEPEKKAVRTPMQVVVQYKQLELIIHPVFQELIRIKWLKYGRFGAWKQTILNFIFIMLWTVIGTTLPVDSDNYDFPADIWRVVLSSIAVAFTLWQIIQELQEFFGSKKTFNRWKDWRTAELERDLEYCHPRWPQERIYLEREIKEMDEMAPNYFSDSWNYFDWFVYILLLSCTLLHVIDIAVDSDDDATGEDLLSKVVHRLFAITIIFLWLRLMKTCRAFQSLGPFIVMLGKIMMDVVRFGYLYLEFWVPYCCAFWMIFGVTGEVKGMETFYGVAYSLFRITLVDEYDYDGMKEIDPIMADILCGTFLAVSAILCLNLMIALLSDTFQRVYDNAQSNAAMQQAAIILGVEDGLGEKKRRKFQTFIWTRCAPEELYYDDDLTSPGGEEDLKKVTIQIKDELDEMNAALKSSRITSSGTESNIRDEMDSLRHEIDKIKSTQDKAFEDIRRDFGNVISLLQIMLKRQGKGGRGGNWGKLGRGHGNDPDDDSGGQYPMTTQTLDDINLQRDYTALLLAQEADSSRVRGKGKGHKMASQPLLDTGIPPNYDYTATAGFPPQAPPRPGTLKKSTFNEGDYKDQLVKYRQDSEIKRKKRRGQEEYLKSKQEEGGRPITGLTSMELPGVISDQDGTRYRTEPPVEQYTDQDELVIHMSEMGTSSPRENLASSIIVKPNVLLSDETPDTSEA